jgi:TonB family protein
MEIMTTNGKTYLRAAGLAMLGFAICCAAPSLRADGNRKAVASPKPVYPQMAKDMRLHGAVKIEIVIAPNGQVRETKALGGHPVLVQAALTAVKDWKFEAGSSESVQVIEFRFDY